MILIGIGANLPHKKHGSPLDTCRHAVGLLENHPHIKLVDLSRWYESAPVPPSDQPWFINAVARIETELSPMELMEALHQVEAQCGRGRPGGPEKGPEKNAPRMLDLDLLDFDGKTSNKTPFIPLLTTNG